jgi:hypothetical protein
MADFILKPEVVCPACWEKIFDISQKGFLVKNYILLCRNCGLSIETSAKQTDFRVLSVGDDYSNATPLLKDKKLTLSQLKNHGLYIIPDSDLEQLSRGEGEIFEGLLNHDFNINIVTKKNEKFFMVFPEVFLKEERSKRVYTPVSGMGFRITKGVYYRLGSVGQSQYSSELTMIDRGNFYISNQRYIFQGSKQTIDQQLSKITAITPYVDALGISRSNKKKVEYYVGGSTHWPFVFALISGVITRNNN